MSEDYEWELKERWGKMLLANDRHASFEHGVDIKEADDGLVEYMTKHGRLPIASGWTTADEMARQSSKLGKQTGRSALQILSDAMAGDSQSKKLYRIYAASTKRRQQIVFSPKLKMLLGVTPERVQLELDRLKTSDFEPFISLPDNTWAGIVLSEKRGELLEISRDGDKQKVEQWLENFRVIRA